MTGYMAPTSAAITPYQGIHVLLTLGSCGWRAAPPTNSMIWMYGSWTAFLGSGLSMTMLGDHSTQRGASVPCFMTRRTSFGRLSAGTAPFERAGASPSSKLSPEEDPLQIARTFSARVTRSKGAPMRSRAPIVRMGWAMAGNVLPSRTERTMLMWSHRNVVAESKALSKGRPGMMAWVMGLG